MKYTLVIGGANVDIQGFPRNKLIPYDSNIGKVKISLGGVGRNIAENLVRLGIDTRLITVIGDDMYGRQIVKEGEKIGIDMEDSLILSNKDTSSYLSILNKEGDMELAISSMDIYDYISIEFINSKEELIRHSQPCIIDTNIPRTSIEYLLKNFPNVDFFLDTVSTAKTRKVKDLIGYFHTIKPNRLEAEILTGVKIKDIEDLKIAASYLHDQGVNRVFITLGEEGVFYSDGIDIGSVRSPSVEVVNATGAGDAFVAALAYGYVNNIDIREVAKLAMSASIVAISHEETINPKMSIERLESKIKENKLC